MRYLIKSIILLFFLSSCCIAAFLEGPYVANITSNSVIIWWKAYPALSGKVFFGKKVFIKKQPPFEIKIKGLRPDTLYKYYVVLSDGTRLPEKGFYRFYTAPKKGKKLRFALLGDSRGPFPLIPLNVDVLNAICNDLLKRKIKFVCFLGDMVFGYAYKERELRGELRWWKSIVFSMLAHEIPVYTAMGNHDVVVHKYKNNYILDGIIEKGKIIYSEEIFADEFVNPENSPEPETPDAPPYKETCYSFDWGNSHFLFINTSYWIAFPVKKIFHESKRLKLYKIGNPPSRIMDKQMRWIENDLKKARLNKNIKHIFVFGHHPVFPMRDEGISATYELKKDMEKRRKKLWEIFAKYKVKAAFFAHEHNYSRTLIKGVWQIITGGAGAPLYKCPKRKGIICKKRHHYCIVTVDANNVSIDVYALKKDMKGFELIEHATL